jgi:hypothetical protein
VPEIGHPVVLPGALTSATFRKSDSDFTVPVLVHAGVHNALCMMEYEALYSISVYPARRRRGTAAAAAAFSESERVCGTLGTVGERGVRVQTDRVR